MTEEQQAKFEGWARVEVMGHQTHIGFVRTEAYGAAVMFRVDAPELPEREYVLESPEYVAGRWTPAGATVQRAAVKGHTVLIGAGDIGRPDVITGLGQIAPVIAIRGNVDTGDWADVIPTPRW